MKKFIFVITTLILTSCSEVIEKSALNINIEGMSCSHSCAPYIRKKLKATEGVIGVKVSFEKNMAEIIINGSETSKDLIIKRIESLVDGQYKVKGVTETKINSSVKKGNQIGNDSDLIEFDITNPDVSHSPNFQLPNIFSLLNSLLN